MRGSSAPPTNHRLKVSSILIPIDFSPPSMKALEHALQLAKQFHAKLTVLHVLEVLAVPEFATYPLVPDSDRLEKVKAKLAALAKEDGPAMHPAALAASAERVIHDVDPGLAVFAVEPLDLTISRSVSQRRFTAFLLGSFAALAVILAAIGVHGLLSYNVARRRQEIGIRMALGAGRGDVLRLVLREGLVIITAALIVV